MAYICPECTQDKCQNCTVEMLDPEQDMWMLCTCDHRRGHDA